MSIIPTARDAAYNAGFYYGRLMQRAAIVEWLRNHAHHNRPADIVRAIQDMVIDGKPEEEITDGRHEEDSGRR